MSSDMPLREDIYRDPKGLEALKSKVKPEEYLKALYERVESKEKEVAMLDSAYRAKYFELEEDFLRKKSEKDSLLAMIDSSIEIKRLKRDEAERPLQEIRDELNLRELKLIEAETTFQSEEQRVFERERAAERKLEDVQLLSDQLGEIRVRQTIRENTLTGKEEALKDKEVQYMVKIEKFSKEVNESAALIQERMNEVTLKELNVQSKEENLVKREKELLNGHILLNDQRGTLERAWAELERKKHGKSRDSKQSSPKRS